MCVPTRAPYTSCPFKCRVAKFACPRVLDDRKMSEDNQILRLGCPPDYQIFLGKSYLKIIICTKLSQGRNLSPYIHNKISLWELITNYILCGIKMRTTKNMTRTTIFPIVVVLRLPNSRSNFDTLKCNLVIAPLPHTLWSGAPVLNL